MANQKMMPGTGGDRYVPFEERTGDSSQVFFTRDLSSGGLQKIFDRVSSVLQGKTAVKLHTGEPNGPNIIPRPWVKDLLANKLKNATVVETNAYYEGGRYTTEDHRKTLETNGWTAFTTVDIMDEDGTAMLPVKNGKWFTEMSVGDHMLRYDSFLALTHFKGHAMGGFGGSNKNIGIGCADGRIGKAMIHTRPGGDQWGIDTEELMERMAESTKATIDYFAGKIAYINVMRNISVSCDCEGVAAEPVVTPDIGIAASFDILSLDQAGVDMIFALKPGDRDAMVERITSRHGLRQLAYMKELGMGNDRYELIDIDHGDAKITAADAVKDVKPFQAS